MTGIFAITAEKIMALMFFFALGFYFVRGKRLSPDAPGALSRLLTTLFCPALTINSMASTLDRAALRANAGLLLTGMAVIAAGIPLSRTLSRRLSGQDENLRATLNYNLLYTNFGYIGYSMILGVFGEAALGRYMLYAVPINISVNLYGRVAVEGGRLSPRSLLNPLSLSTFLGLLIGLAGLRLPGVVTEVLSLAGGCTGPVSMLVTGMALGRVDLKRCAFDPLNYVLAALRLAILPLLALGLLLAVGVRGEALMFTGCFLCLPFGSNPVVFREALGMDTQQAAGMTFVSYVFSILTVPLMFSLFYGCQR